MAKKKWGDPAEHNPAGGWCEGVSDYDPDDTWPHRLYLIIEFILTLALIGGALYLISHW